MFLSDYGNTEQKLSVHFTALEVLLHQQAICSLLLFARSLQESLAPTPQSPLPPPVVAATAAANAAILVAKKTAVEKAVDKMKGNVFRRCFRSIFQILCK